MEILSRLGIAYLVLKVFKYMFDLFGSPKINEVAGTNKYEIEYYSEGKLLPSPFHKEYRMIVNTVANSWIYEEQWQDLVNDNHDAPIVEIDIKLPLSMYFWLIHTYRTRRIILKT